MTSVPPKNLAHSVRDRLLKLAKARGEDFNFVLVRYALERLLYRLSKSAHGGEFILKGAMLFTIWSNHPHRATKDLDFLPRLDWWCWPQRFDLELDGCERFESHAISTAASDHEAVALAVKSIDFDHSFEGVDQPDVGHALPSVDGQLALAIDPFAAR